MSKAKSVIDILDFMAKEQGLTKISLKKYGKVLTNAQREWWGELRKEYERTQEIADDIRPWIEIASTTTTDSTGKFTLPLDYGKYTGLYIGDDETEVDIVKESSISKRVISELIPISSTRPIAALRGNYFQFYPKEALNGIMMVYIRQPADVEISFTVASNRETYNGVNQDLECTENSIDEIIKRAAFVLFPALNDENIQAYAQAGMALEQKQ